MKKGLLFFLLWVIFCASALGEGHTRDEVRERYLRAQEEKPDALFEEEPSLDGDLRAGNLSDQALESALRQVNFFRYLAYLDDDVTLDELYALRAQHGAVLLAMNDCLDHDPPCPADMPEDFYESARAGTLSSNIASLNWFHADALNMSVEYFVRDDGEGNAEELGHRRWLLSPALGATGFGLAVSETGRSYAVMYAADFSGDASDWSTVAWPSRGAFPAEFLSAKLPWSVTLNPSVYRMEQPDCAVRLSVDGREAPLSGMAFNTENFGAGPCLIFQPDLAACGLENYQQNQTWRVEITGLERLDGGTDDLAYEVELISLYPADPVAVETEPRQLTLTPGESAVLTARVLPDWADDLTVVWESDCPEIAEVDETGKVTARKPGSCGITAVTVNGKSDVCAVTVKGE